MGWWSAAGNRDLRSPSLVSVLVSVLVLVSVPSFSFLVPSLVSEVSVPSFPSFLVLVQRLPGSLVTGDVESGTDSPRNYETLIRRYLSRIDRHRHRAAAALAGKEGCRLVRKAALAGGKQLHPSDRYQ